MENRKSAGDDGKREKAGRPLFFLSPSHRATRAFFFFSPAFPQHKEDSAEETVTAFIKENNGGAKMTQW